jgi:hypothetical protein
MLMTNYNGISTFSNEEVCGEKVEQYNFGNKANLTDRLFLI